jgi:hypothetical protein
MQWNKMMSNRYPSYIYLTYAAVINFVLALLHVVVPFKGVTDYIYFGTNKLALLEFHGEPLTEPAAFILALVFAVFGVYCLSGAELMRRLYLLNPVLWFIGGLYTLRGLLLIPYLLGYTSGEINPTLQLFFSTAALVIGLMILIGMRKKNIESMSIE